MLFDDDQQQDNGGAAGFDDTIVFPGEEAGGYGSTSSNRPPSAVLDLDLPPPPDTDVEYGAQEGYGGPRPKNFPPCYPKVHHNIKNDIDVHRRLFVKRAYIGFWFHSITLVINLVAITAGLVVGVSTTPWSLLEAIAAVLLGPPISFMVYYLVYTAIRKNSSVYMVLWFFCFGCQIIFEGFAVIGVVDGVGAGFIGMIAAFGKNVVVGIMYLVCSVAWLGCILYNIFVVGNGGRKEYAALGGHKAAAKGFANAGAQAAYDNRDTIAEVARENKDAIRDFAVEHKDDIRDFAVDNRDVIAEVAVENKDLLVQTAMENPDLVASSRNDVDSIFQ